MNTFLNRFINVSRYESTVEKDRARLVYGAILVVISIYTLYAFVARDWSAPGVDRDVSLIESLAYRTDTWFYLIMTFVLAIVGWALTRRGVVNVAGWMPIAMLFVLSCVPVLVNSSGTFANPVNAVILAALIVLSGLLNGYTGSLIGIIIASASLLLRPAPTADVTIILLLEFLGLGIISYLYNRFTRLSRNQGEIEANQERLKFAEMNTAITRRASERAPLQEVMDLAINLILEKYPQFYHAQVFLLDETGVQARLVASTGTVGQKLLARVHGLAVGSLSVIGQVTLKGTPTIEIAGAPNTMHRFNELLPETRIEAAFPLRTGNEIIGALDLQCKDIYAFTREDIPTFQSVADSLSLVIDNVRQFEISRQRIVENQRLTEQSRNALREVERLNKRLIGRAWADFLRNTPQNVGLNVEMDSEVAEADARWTPTLAEAAQNNEIIQQDRIIAVPLRVRGQIIGAMEFELDNSNEVSPEDMELLQDVSERFGLAAENTRLVEESQRIAQREAMINEISTRLQGTNNVEATLTEAARSLRETLQAQRVVVRLGVPPRKSPEGKAQ